MSIHCPPGTFSLSSYYSRVLVSWLCYGLLLVGGVYTVPMVKLTERQARFVSEYLIDGNGAQSAIRAGYSRHTAPTIASTLLTNVKVRAAFDARKLELAASVELTQEHVLRGLMRVTESPLHISQHVRAWELLGKHVGLFRDAPVVLPSGGASLEVTARLTGLSDDELRRIAFGVVPSIGSVESDTALLVTSQLVSDDEDGDGE
jgi:hypothetical protein